MSRIQASSSGRSTISTCSETYLRASAVSPVLTTRVTGSYLTIVLATAAQASRPVCRFSGVSKVGLLVGKAIQVRSCGCHSAGIR